MSGIQMALLGAGATAPYVLVTGGTGSPGSFFRGYNGGFPYGTLTPTAFTLNGATQINAFYYDQSSGIYLLQVNGGTNTGWTTVVVDTTFVLIRGLATFTAGASPYWTWSTTDTIINQAFGTNGSSHNIVFT